MKDPNKSHYEKEALEFLKEDKTSKSFISYHYYSELQVLTDKLIGVCEELRISRENWKNKFESFKSSKIDNLRSSRDVWKKKYMDIKNGINGTNNKKPS